MTLRRLRRRDGDEVNGSEKLLATVGMLVYGRDSRDNVDGDERSGRRGAPQKRVHAKRAGVQPPNMSASREQKQCLRVRGYRGLESLVLAARYRTGHGLEFAAQGFESLRLGLEAAILEAGTYTQKQQDTGGGSGEEGRNVDVASTNYEWRDQLSFDVGV
ncbi:hypothetical protein B0H14DRAFT_2649740 [Mycena olivaceomarginata]|nr:hypothetical protein B0H14DRAFT_2649740 [Mycena olivaceomarginata]